MMDLAMFVAIAQDGRPRASRHGFIQCWIMCLLDMRAAVGRPAAVGLLI